MVRTKGAATFGFRQRPVGAPHLHCLGIAEASAAKEPDDRVAPAPRERREEGRHHVLASRQGGEPEDPTHLTAQAPGVDQHQALATFRELIGELHGDTTAEGLPDHSGPVDAKEVEEVPHDGGKVAERVVAEGFFRRPVPEEVWGQYRVVALKEPHRRDPRERASGDAVKQQQHRALTASAVADLVAVE